MSNLKKTEKNENLVNYHEIPSTPFTKATLKNEKGEIEEHLLMGNYRLNEFPLQKGDAVKIAKGKSWNLILQVISILIENQDKLKKSKKDEQ